MSPVLVVGSTRAKVGEAYRLSVVGCLGSSRNASSRTNGTCQSWRYDRRSDQSCRTICMQGRENVRQGMGLSAHAVVDKGSVGAKVY